MVILESLERLARSGSRRVKDKLQSIRRARRFISSGPDLESRLTSVEIQLTELNAQVGRLMGLESALKEQGAQLGRLEADLDESRRLNLRAAELLDIAFNQLSRPD